MIKFRSPLRYPGSKIKLIGYLKKVLDFNNFHPNILVEPFVGGGSVFLNFLLNNWVENVIIGDKDSLINSFWKILFKDPQYLISFIHNVEINIKNFYFYKKIMLNDLQYGERKLAEACLFLNRTSFSGILVNNVGPIGGKKQNSKYKINCRFNKELLIKKIKKISSFSSKVTVLPNEWNYVVNYALENFKEEKLLFYFDPPFYNKASKLYKHYFNNIEFHLELNRKLKNLEYSWILSYDRVPEIKEMYLPFIQKNLAFPYSINSPAKRIEKEYFITSKNLLKPTKDFLVK